MQSNVPEWASVQPAGGERHLPVYLLLDTSGSMDGAPIQSVQSGLEQFQQETASDPFARDVVRVGVITFNSNAQVLSGGLVPISSFQPPHLSASGVTRVDLAFNRLVESMDRDVVKAVKGGQKGDWKPAVFILTDGYPTDENGNVTDRLWRPARDAVTNRPKGQIKPSSIVAVGCGPNVDDATLKAMSTGMAFRMGTSEAAFAALFQYLSQSITSSVQPGGNLDDPFADVQPSSDLIRIP
ncbi:VWA domain-containing protein [Candidatus Chloroploca sp. M-50]|uniref:VWA domain-containing protein n=2 Tax=Candidatus Chloroploca mongolica TaxID=2528176 RepID=A0ABS4DH97_9CHLR|nr:VWA domain-containing protein [Candidatus Chloroploca mongolica]